MEWRDLFDSYMLQRGYDYYLDGSVWDLTIEGDTVSALVSGTDEYHVQIQFDKDGSQIKSMKCDCPYAERGGCCKHEAAVMYHLDDLEE